MPAAGEIIQVTIGGILDGQLIENVLNMRERTPATLDSQIATSANALKALWGPILSNGFIFNSVMFKRMTPVAFDTQFAPPASPAAGSQGGAFLVTTVAQVTTLRTGVAGKTHRGRIYVGGLAQGWADGNRLSSTAITAFNTWAAALVTQFDDATGTDPYLALGIYSREIGGTNPFTLAGWQAVTQVIPHSILGNQRRRRVGVGA
jgi:hypothetical protein